MSSRAGLALLITTCTLERDPYPDQMVFPKGLYADGFSLLPMTVHSSKGVLGSGLESEPVHLQEPSMAADQALLEEERAAVASGK